MALETAIGVLRAISGLLITLFIPGFALTLALFPRKRDMKGIERIALSSVLSIAVTVLGALVLDRVLGIDYTALNMAAALLVFSIIFFVVYLMETKGKFE